MNNPDFLSPLPIAESVTFTPNEVVAAMLESMGFSRAQCVMALQNTEINIERTGCFLTQMIYTTMLQFLVQHLLMRLLCTSWQPLFHTWELQIAFVVTFATSNVMGARLTFSLDWTRCWTGLDAGFKFLVHLLLFLVS